MKKETWYCEACDREMEKIMLPHYEYVEGIPLQQVPAYQCPQCKELLFTEEQAKAMEKRMETFMEQKVDAKGKHLVITIPQKVAEKLGIKQGSKVRIVPVMK